MEKIFSRAQEQEILWDLCRIEEEEQEQGKYTCNECGHSLAWNSEERIFFCQHCGKIYKNLEG